MSYRSVERVDASPAILLLIVLNPDASDEFRLLKSDVNNEVIVLQQEVFVDELIPDNMDMMLL